MSSVAVTLDPGWNIFAYIGRDGQITQETLKAIQGNYSMAWGYKQKLWPKPWLAYDPTIPASHPMYSYVNNLQHFDYGSGYWIYVTATGPITLYVKGASDSVLTAAADQSVVPPSAFYGLAATSSDFTPLAGMEVTAWINNKLCGRSQIQTMNEQLGYVIHIEADTGGDSSGCGMIGREIEFKVGNVPMAIPGIWNNTNIHYLPLLSKFDHLLFMPLVVR